jgi:phospholipid-binding lipoprotein MlaA
MIKIVFTFLLGVCVLVAAEAKAAPLHAGVVVDVEGTNPDKAARPAPDPYEEINRDIYDFNESVDEIFLEPIARGYKKVVPEWGRDRVGNFMNNITEPVTFFNSLLQGDIDHSLVTFWRFVLNTTIGLGGIYDQAQYAGLERRPEDFGQTLATSGDAKTGDYIVIPLLGPSSSRDAFGLVVDSLTNPFNYVGGGLTYTRNGLNIVHGRSESLELTDEIDRTSFDPYAAIKSAYSQHRQGMVENLGKQKTYPDNQVAATPKNRRKQE